MNEPPNADDDIEQAIDEALGGKPRSRDLALMIQAVEERSNYIRRQLSSSPDSAEKSKLAKRLHDLEKQVHLLREEKAITEFVENSVHFTFNSSGLDA